MRVLFLPLVAAGIIACQPAGKDYSGDIARLQADLESVKADLELERVRGVDSNGRIQKLEAAPRSEKIEWAILDPAGGDGYSKIDTNLAPILLTFQDSAPVGDGTKIKLQVGNMTSATLAGIKLKINYNVRAPVDRDALSEWSKSTRTIDVTLTDRLYPGTWTAVSASLPGIKPDQLGFIAVKGELNNVVMKTAE